MKNVFVILAIVGVATLGLFAVDYTPMTEESTVASATITALTATTIDASGAVEAATVGIEDGTADGYFERVGDALNWVEGGVTNAVVADVTS